MFDPDDIGARIRRIRDEQNIGLLEAEKIVTREKLIKIINEAKTVEDLKPILIRLIALS